MNEREAKRAKRAVRDQGPCGICGGPYAAHRTIDTQMGCVIAGDDIAQVANGYDTTVAEMVTHWHAYIEVLQDDASRKAKGEPR